MTPDAGVRRRALALLGVLTLVWGTNWPLFPLAMREVSVWTFRAVTMIAAGLLLLAVARLRGQPLALPRSTWLAVTAGALAYLAVWNIASALAAVMIPSGQAAVLGFTMPLWVALISWLAFGERLTARHWLALALAACGVLLLAWRSLEAYAQAPLGVALALLAALGWALGTLIVKRSGVPVPATVLTGWQLLLAAVPVSAGALVFGDGQWFWPSPMTWLVLAYIAIVPMSLGNVAWFAIVGLLPASVAGLSAILVPVVAMLSGALVLGEPLGPLQLLAMACCTGAVALVMWGGARRA
ncbi:DMT family transporter [Pseudorhodoferax sp.]|uniref:DMT family transporter n=1 Tax=Pseudorhodoferax sp. TaxID=1993553 RepID=UPI002DD6303E|nr:DMT family transporter [Pseudorhodoferax sp.]